MYTKTKDFRVPIPLPPYTCRATRVAADFLGCSCAAMVSRYTGPQGPGSARPASTARGVACQAASQRCRATGVCSYTCERRATLCNYARRTGVQNTFLGGLSSVRVPSPSFFLSLHLEGILCTLCMETHQGPERSFDRALRTPSCAFRSHPAKPDQRKASS